MAAVFWPPASVSILVPEGYVVSIRARIGVHVRPEWVFTMGWNMQWPLLPPKVYLYTPLVSPIHSFLIICAIQEAMELKWTE